MSEQRKRIQIRNSLEEKSLKEKIRRYNREQNYVDKELRQIILAKQSLLKSLRSINIDQDSSSAGRTSETKRQNSGKEQASTRVTKETYNASQFCSSSGTNNVDADVKIPRNGRKVSPRQKFLKTSFAGHDPELPSLTTFRGGSDTRNVMSPPLLSGNTKTNSSLDLTGCSKPGKDGASTKGTENRSLGKKHSEKQTETKSCLHVQSKHLPRKDSKVRFSVPLITKQLETEEIWEISDGGKNPSKLNSENSKAYRTSSRFESNSGALEKIKVRSKFYQVGSVALATAIFKSASEKTSSSDNKQVLRGDELQKKCNGQEKKAEKEKPNEQRHKIVRSKSGYLTIPLREKEILVRRISSASQGI